MRKLMLFVLFLSGLSVSANAVELTIYDDGRSCPAECDAHVVFHPSLNGTNYAHSPESSSQIFEKCVNGNACEICFSIDPEQCMEVMYRGNGPGTNTFDLTPRFYSEWCSKEQIPQKLASKCEALKETATKLDGRINCITEREHPRCVGIMDIAISSKEADRPKYEQCLELGQAAYNAGKLETEKRVYGCAYEYLSNGGPNSRGLRWRKLLPAACRENTFVGKDGLDCCSGNEFVDGALHVECRNYYPVPE